MPPKKPTTPDAHLSNTPDAAAPPAQPEAWRRAGFSTRVVPISSLKSPAWNPRKISDFSLNALGDSLGKFGYVEPVVWNVRSGRVVGGNQRLKALKKHGVQEVEVVEVDLSDEDEKALNVALNAIHGEWVPELLADVLRSIGEEARMLTGLTDDEIRKHLDLPIPEFPEGDPKARAGKLERGEVKNVYCPKCHHNFPVRVGSE